MEEFEFRLDDDTRVVIDAENISTRGVCSFASSSDVSLEVDVIAPESMLGTSTDVKITSVGRWSVFGEVLEFPEPPPSTKSTPLTTSMQNSCNDCTCSTELEPCNTGLQSLQNCGKNSCENEVSCCDTTMNRVVKTETLRSKTLVNAISTLITRRRVQSDVKNDEHESHKQERNSLGRLATFDWILLAGMFSSCVVIVVLLFSLYI